MQGFEQKKRQILDRVDLVEVVSEQVTLRRSGRRLVGLCPFHTEKSPSFTVSPEMGLFKCFGCGKGGDLFSFVQYRENVDFMEALRMLADRAGVELGSSTVDGKRGPDGKSGPDGNSGTGRAEIAKVNEWAVDFFRRNLVELPCGEIARSYVVGRQISDSISEQFELGASVEGMPSLVESARRAGFGAEVLVAADLLRSGDDGRRYETFRQRLIFPIRDAMRRVIGFGGRTLVDDRAKYLNTRQNELFDKGRSLYGVDRARDSIVSRGRAVVVEGYTDCIAAHQGGFTETVATLGTAMTESHVELLRRYADQAILLFDSDRAGLEAADRAIRVALPRCLDCRMARIPDGKDPSEFLGLHGVEAFSDVLNRAIGALEFKRSQIEEELRSDGSPARRREAVLDFLRVVAEGADGKAVDAIQRGLLVNQVAHLLRMDRGEIDAMLTQLAPRRKAAPVGQQVVRSGGGSGGGSHSGDVVPGTVRDHAQRDWVRVLEVILNEPGLLSVVGGLGDIAGIVDARDRRIAEVALRLADRLGEFRMADVLSELHDPADVSRAADLALAGAGRCSYEAELRDAVDRIRRREAALAFEHTKRSLLGQPDGPRRLTDGCAEGEAVRDGVEAHRHFVPLRLRRKADLGGSDSDPGGGDPGGSDLSGSDLGAGIGVSDRA